MSFIRHLVSPKLPTMLANDTHVDLPGYDIWFADINNVHVFPTQLDVSIFEDALSKTLQLYPHAAGQLRRAEGRWFIELTNTAIPVDIDHKLNMTPDSFLHGNWVMQDNLSPFLNEQPFCANSESINGSAPLLRLKLTFFNCETCIGISWNHSLGDGIVLLRFMHTLSQFYQGLPPGFAAPTFKKHHFPMPSHSIVAAVSSLMLIRPPCPFDKAARVNSRKDFGHLMWCIESHDLEELRSALCSHTNNRKFLSKHACLVAYLVAIMNCNRINPVQKVWNLSSFRHISASFIAENVASNLLLEVPANIPTDMTGIATTVRDALIRCREPYYIYNLVALKSQVKLEAANTGKPLPFPFDDNELIVNSHTMIDWCSAHFGCPDGTRFHTAGISKHYLRCFRSNPVKGDNDVWKTRQSIDISMGVSTEQKPKMLETLARGVQYMLDDQHVLRA